MWAMPSATFFFTFLRTRAAAVGATGGFAMYGILVAQPAFGAAAVILTAALRGPLRVRALVRVGWPRTGRPLRWRVPREEPSSVSRLMFMDTSRRNLAPERNVTHRSR